MSEFLRPASLQEALALLHRRADCVVIAGGTDCMVASKHRQDAPAMIDLFGLPELCTIDEYAHGLRIGAAATYQSILAHALVRRRFPMLAMAVREIGAAQIQARGTMGGNIATSSPVGDTLPVLLALDAAVELASMAGIRKLPYRDFCTGYRKTALGSGELITAILLPWQPDDVAWMWRKVGTRRAQSISKVMFAGTARMSDGVVAESRLALGAVADRPIRARATEAVLIGQAPSAGLAERCREALAQELAPIDDLRSTASYRLTAAQNLIARFVLGLVRGQ